jgi:hypothetical protein
MAWFKRSKQPTVAEQVKADVRAEVEAVFKQLENNSVSADPSSLRGRIAGAISGGYDFADTMHNVFLDFGYPQTITFAQFWNMYRRFGIAKNVADLPVETGWMTPPIVEGSEQFNGDLERMIKDQHLWKRVKGLDNRQRVGRYAGLFMRVRDGKTPSQPIEGKFGGAGALVQMIPLYEGQLTVLETENDPTADDYGQPTMYQFNGGSAGNRNEKIRDSFSIHPSRIIIAAEDSDNGSIQGVSSLEAAFNSLMDLRKIIGAGGEGFYRNAAQSVVFSLKDGASSKTNAPQLEAFNEQFDDFTRNRMRRSFMSPGLDPNVMSSDLGDPKNHFNNALNDVAAASKTPATILIGQQTGRLASSEDGRQHMSMVNSRRENFMTEMVTDVLDWLIKWGILPASEFTVEWDDLLTLSDKEKLENADKMATVNEKQFKSGGSPVFEADEIREAAGFDPEDELPPGDETLPDDDKEEIDDD